MTRVRLLPLGIHLVSLALFVLVASPVAADVQRFAVVIGNNLGSGQDAPLRYAVTDAERVRGVLHDLGGFAAYNTVLLRNESPDVVRRTLHAINERVRDAVAQPGTDAMLVIYYSGHADAQALHLGNQRFAIQELSSIARGSAADFRLVVLDACRSGAITRAKGGKRVEPFPLSQQERLPGTGLAFLSASTERESAQESDALQGSFFTHALVSGLLGAADRNHNGEVSLAEAYHYAYGATLRGTSQTYAGPQHPSFRYDFSGQGELVLTHLQAAGKTRARVELPENLDFIIMRDGPRGQVVAELSAHTQPRVLSLASGRFFLRGRGKKALYEGTIDAAPGVTREVRVEELQQIQFAHRARKGGPGAAVVHNLEVGAYLRTSLKNAKTPCWGGFVGYGIDGQELGLQLRLDTCTASSRKGDLDTSVNSYGLAARLYRAWDVSMVSLDLGLAGGLSFAHQHFAGITSGPDRVTFVPHLGASVGATISLYSALFARTNVSLDVYFLNMQPSGNESSALVADPALRFGASLGCYL